MTLSDVPARYRKLHQKALEGRRPLLAIRANCAMCMGWEDTARAIAECRSRTCPLWPYRTGKRAPRVAPSASAAPRIDESGSGPPKPRPEPVLCETQPGNAQALMRRARESKGAGHA